jgi:hypothetical protein
MIARVFDGLPLAASVQEDEQTGKYVSIHGPMYTKPPPTPGVSWSTRTKQSASSKPSPTTALSAAP